MAFFLIKKTMSLKKTIENIVALTVLSGSQSNNVSVFLPTGKISHVAAFFRDYSGINAGFVRASIKDVNGSEVSQMQSIDNYRDREAGYHAGKKPLPVDGGNNYTVTVQATEAFTGDFLVEFVFVYEEDCQQ